MSNKYKSGRAARLPIALLALSTVLMVLYVIFAAGLQTTPVKVSENLADRRPAECTPEYVAGLDEEFVSESGCPSVIQALVTFDKVDLVEKKNALFRVRLFPDGDQGMSLQNGGVLFEAARLSIDGTGQTNYYLNADEWAQAQTASVPIKNLASLISYPFDRYAGEFSMIIQSTESGATLPLWLTASPSDVSGYSISMEKVSQPEDIGDVVSANSLGYGRLKFNIERSSGDIFQVLLLLFVLIVGAASGALTTLFIVLGHRPPSLSILAWLATYLFSLIQVRNQFPGNPPLGLTLDRYFTFPAIALVMVFIVINAWAWLRRDDWDMENRESPRPAQL